jgi:hypothetical protein
MEDSNKEDMELIPHPDGYYIKHQTGVKFSTRPSQTLKHYEYVEPNKLIKKNRKTMNEIIAHLSNGRSITGTCNAVGITASTLRNWRQSDEGFNQACIDAIDVETDNQEVEVQERIFRGTRTETYNSDGELERTVYAQNDQLLLRSLAARRPEKWKQVQNTTNIALSNRNSLTKININFDLSAQELSKFGHVQLASEYMTMLENERKSLEDST